MAGGNTDVKGVREMIGVRASVKWLLTAVAVLSGVSLAAQVLPGEEGILERGRRLPGEVSAEALVDSVARWGRTEREKVIVLAGWFREYMAIDVGRGLPRRVEGEEGNLRGFHGVVRGVMQQVGDRERAGGRIRGGGWPGARGNVSPDESRVERRAGGGGVVAR